MLGVRHVIEHLTANFFPEGSESMRSTNVSDYEQIIVRSFVDHNRRLSVCFRYFLVHATILQSHVQYST